MVIVGMVDSVPIDIEALEQDTYQRILRAIVHPLRRRILRHLTEGACTYTQLLESLNVVSSQLAYHLNVLGELVVHRDEVYHLSRYGGAAITLMQTVEGRLKDDWTGVKPIVQRRFATTLWRTIRRPYYRFFVCWLVAGVCLYLVGINVLGFPALPLEMEMYIPGDNGFERVLVDQGPVMQQSIAQIGVGWGLNLIISGVVLFGLGIYLLRLLFPSKELTFIALAFRYISIAFTLGAILNLALVVWTLLILYGGLNGILYTLLLVSYPLAILLMMPIFREIARLSKETTEWIETLHHLPSEAES